jgi:hypothetical protein
MNSLLKVEILDPGHRFREDRCGNKTDAALYGGFVGQRMLKIIITPPENV